MASADEFRYFICDRCSLTFIEKIPENLERHYLNEQYDIPADGRDFELRAQSQLWKIDLLKMIASPGRLFEVGPATGEFAFVARQAGFRPTLAEMDKDCSRFLRDVLKLDVVNTSLPAECLEGSEGYDVICIWQAIEHIPEFWRLMNRAADSLRKNGVIVISTPNPESIQARLLGRFWPHIDAPRHLYLIPQRWFRSFARRHGLSVVLDTTRDVGSTGLNYYGWYLATRNFTRGILPDPLARTFARIVTRILRHWEEAEGKGCSYTIALRRT